MTPIVRSVSTDRAILSASVVVAAGATWGLYLVAGQADPMAVMSLVWLGYRVIKAVRADRFRRSLRHHRVVSARVQVVDKGKREQIVLGSGFAWTDTEAQSVHDLGAGSSPTGTTFQAVGRAAPVTMDTSQLSSHMLIEGRTRSGKSVAGALIARSLITKARGSVVVMDPKSDSHLIGHVITAAGSAGRKLAVFAPYMPQVSCAINPLSSCRAPAEVRARLSALMPPSREAYFASRALLALERTAALQQAVGEAWDLDTLLRDATVTERRQHLLARYLQTIGVAIDPGDVYRPPSVRDIRQAYASAGIQDRLAEMAIEDVSTDREHYKSVTDNIHTALGDIVNTSWCDLITSPHGLSWTEIDRDEMVVMILTSTLLTRELGRKVGTLLTQDWLGYMGRRMATDRDAEVHPMYLMVDELAQVAYPGLSTAFATVGGAGGRLIAMWQSRAALQAAMGEHQAQDLLDNIQCRIHLSTADDQTASQVADAIGEGHIIRSTDSRRRDDDNDFSLNRALSRQRQRLIEPQWLHQLPPGHAWARVNGIYHKLHMPMLELYDVDMVKRLGYEDLIEPLRRAKERARLENMAHELHRHRAYSR